MLVVLVTNVVCGVVGVGVGVGAGGGKEVPYLILAQPTFRDLLPGRPNLMQEGIMYC